MIPREDILRPIAGENPSGESLRYASVFTQIKEAAREEDDISQGVWATERKTADWPKVGKLCLDALVKQSKDLQLAAWLTESETHREGFTGFLNGIGVIAALLEQFWDTIHPELEDGDSEMRAVPLLYVASKLEVPLRRTPITAVGLSWYQYKESTTVPSEEEASSDESKSKQRSLAVQDGKTTPEDMNDALGQTQSAFLDEQKALLAECSEAIETLDNLCNERFGDNAPNFRPVKDCLAEISNSVRILKQRKEESGGAQGQQRKQPASAPASSDAFGSSSDPFASSSSDAFGSDSSSSDPFGSDSAAAVAEPPSDPFGDTSQSDPFGGGSTVVQEPEKQSSSYTEQRSAYTSSSYGVEPDSPADCARRIAAAANFLRAQDPTNPASYLLLRGWRWGELRASGPTPNWALLVAAPLEVRQTLKRLSLEPDWEKLLESSEEAMATEAGRGWLDIQRYTLLALDSLGEEYAKAAGAIREDLHALLAEYPDLLNSALDDDTPAASPQTKEYLAQQGVSGGEGRKSAPAASEPTPEELIREAVKKGRHEIALAIVARQMKLESSGRARFQWKVEQAQILMQAGRAAVAFPILKEVTAELFERRLEDWEPASVVVDPLVLYYRCLQELGVDGEERQRIYATVCRLDPVRAFELG